MRKAILLCCCAGMLLACGDEDGAGPEGSSSADAGPAADGSAGTTGGARAGSGGGAGTGTTVAGQDGGGAGASGGESGAGGGAGMEGGVDAGVDAGSDAGGVVESFDHVYDVGPQQPYADPGEVPWESLAPGSLVRIHHRQQPYASKWVINTEATAEEPVVVRGIPDVNGNLPVITGENAVTRLELNYWNEERSVIKVGGSNLPTDQEVPSHIRIENLDIRSARPAYSFTDETGAGSSYSSNAAAIHVEVGDHVTVRNCILHDSGNGFFAGHGSSNLLLEGNYIYDNGIEGSIYEHNNYTESFGITFQYNRFGPLRADCLGNNLKDRSAGTVIRYNFIESGNRQLDLVESDYRDFVDDPSYQSTFVYGNILVEPEGAGNSQIVHYGGDGGDQSMYRSGTLYFYHNTVVSTRSSNTTLLRLSTNDVNADVRDNIIYATAGGERLAICSSTGDIALADNWLSSGWRQTHESSLQGNISAQGNLEGSEPGFVDAAAQDFRLLSTSVCVGAAGELEPAVQPAHQVTWQYIAHRSSEPRPDFGDLCIGALAVGQM